MIRLENNTLIRPACMSPLLEVSRHLDDQGSFVIQFRCRTRQENPTGLS